jgi:hypothetical protein
MPLPIADNKEILLMVPFAARIFQPAATKEAFVLKNPEETQLTAHK